MVVKLGSDTGTVIIPSNMGAEKLRKIDGPLRDPNGWRIRTDDELQVMCGKANSVTTIKVRRL